MRVPIHQVDGIVGTHVDVVGVGGNAVRSFPGRHRVSIRVEYQHGRPLPLKHVHSVMAVDGNSADAPEPLANRETGPFRLVFVHVIAHTDCGDHIVCLRRPALPAFAGL